MIAVDTNVVVRLLTQDDEQQYNKSFKLFQKQDIFIPDTVILETEWVLRFAYRFKPNEICIAFRNLLGLPNVQLTNGSLMAQVLRVSASNFVLFDTDKKYEALVFSKFLLKTGQFSTNN